MFGQGKKSEKKAVKQGSEACAAEEKAVEEAVDDQVAVPAAQQIVRSQLVVKSIYLDPQDRVACEGGVPIGDFDCLSLLDRYALPPLSRMSSAEQMQFVEPLASLARIRALGLDTEAFQFPEAHWRRIYNSVKAAVGPFSQRPCVDFEGACASDLNAFLHAHVGSAVRVRSAELSVDETIVVPSHTSLRGSGVRLVQSDGEEVEKAILLDGVDGAEVSGFSITLFKWPIFVKSSSNLVISDNDISFTPFKGIVLIGNNHHFLVARNRLHRTGNGGLFFHGDIALGVVEDNVVAQPGGPGNFSGGMVLTALPIGDMDTAFNPWKQLDL
ncbi:MAG: right-handed parallel beta-helix repeat-containing protein, partial [Eggerthellaceae bacterium]|nr:right-handed parallel beta-helix repeat-containing protein [Eggerthellaceae bacterium]